MPASIGAWTWTPNGAAVHVPPDRGVEEDGPAAYEVVPAAMVVRKRRAVAGIAALPWTGPPELRDVDLGQYRDAARWHDAFAARPAAQRGAAVLAERPRQVPITDTEGGTPFGKMQLQAR